MPSADSSPSGRALYDQASSAFVHNMPLETLCIVQSALEAGKERNHPQLAERFLVLKLTALFTAYVPNDKARFEARIKQWRRQSSGSAARRRRQSQSGGMASSAIEDGPSNGFGSMHASTSELSRSTGSLSADEEQLPAEVLALLQEAPPVFLARVWAMCLRYAIEHPIVPSVGSHVPNTRIDTISSTPETLLAALQLPTSVCEALVAGALKLDLTLSQQSAEIRSKKSVKATKDDTASTPGLQASRAICEWVLGAYANIDMDERSVKERAHLQAQYSKVLRLYSLELLGGRLDEWEYAREVVRCAQVLAPQQELQREMQERERLLHDIDEAERQASRKQERRQAAREQAQRLIDEQVAKRTASANAAAAAAMAEPSARRAASALPRDESASYPASSSAPSTAPTSGRSTPASSLSPDSEKQAQLGGPDATSQEKTRPRQVESARPGSSTSDSKRREPVRTPAADGASKRSNSSGPPARRPQHGGLTATLSLETVRTFVLRWLRQLGPAPALACAVLAVLMLRRRALGRKAVAAPPGTRAAGSSAAQLAATHRRAMAGGASNPGMVSFLWQKISDTLRMGTQVTYL